MTRLLLIPALIGAAVMALTTAGAQMQPAVAAPVTAPAAVPEKAEKPFVAQVVGLQWLNPLQRRDYPTEWQILWAMGLVKPNQNDDMVRTDPKSFSTLQPVVGIANGNDGEETFKGFHHKYVTKFFTAFDTRYAVNPRYFYNVADKNGKGWRELAGLRVEYALPTAQLEPAEAADYFKKEFVSFFEIGSVYRNGFKPWTRNLPPDIRITQGGANAGFTSLAAALDYLKAHPKETVWAMSWDAPSFPPKDSQMNENMVALFLAGPDLDTEREPLAWIGYPASKPVKEFETKRDLPPRAVQAWKVTIEAAAHNVNKKDTDIGYVIHDAANSSDRLGQLAQTLTTEMPEFDFIKQTFNTPAVLGEMRAGTALTNVVLAIGYANHFGKSVLVAGTSDAEHPTAVVVTPPAKPRPIDPAKPWFRARGDNNAYLPWWGLRRDAQPREQGFSE